MCKINFVHLHCHSIYSTFDGFMSPKEMAKETHKNFLIENIKEDSFGINTKEIIDLYVEKYYLSKKELAKEIYLKFGIKDSSLLKKCVNELTKEFKVRPSIAITDHGKVGGFVKFQKACKERNIKPIFGVEMYLSKDLSVKKDKRYHILLLAKNKTGYKNILKICTEGHKFSAYGFPRINLEILKKYKDGIIVSTACLGGEFAKLILNDKIEEAYLMAKEYKEIWGDDFYIELMYTGIEDQKIVLKEAIKCADELGIKLIATNDAHYTKKEDCQYQQVKKSISINKPLDSEDSSHYYLKNFDEMRQIFKKDKGLEILNNTVEVANKCNYEIEFGNAKLPDFKIPKDNEEFNEFLKYQHRRTKEQSYLRFLSLQGLRDRGLSDSQEHIDRLNNELETIEFTGFDKYFLIVHEYCEFARNNDVLVGVGRGCFLPDSKVILSNGNKTSIKDIEKGCKVLSHDNSTNEVIEKFIYDIEEKIIVIEMEDGRKIKCTNDHRILIQNKKTKKWLLAKELKENDFLVDVKNKTTSRIKNVKQKSYKGKVYDLCIDDKHTYNIEGLAVHNSGVGSLVLYCLKVTDGTEPIKYGLDMDRFLYAEAEYRLKEKDLYTNKENKDILKSTGRGNRLRVLTREEKIKLKDIISLIVKNIKDKKIGNKIKNRIKEEIDFLKNKPTLFEDIYNFMSIDEKGDINLPNSLLLYMLGLTSGKPNLDKNFKFEFVLDKEQTRISPPDIDIDFSDREPILEHLKELYGSENVAYIGTVGTYGPKASVQFAAKSLNIMGDNDPSERKFSSANDQEGKRLSKIMTNLPLTLEQWLGEDKNFKPPNKFIAECIDNLKEEKNKNQNYKKVFETAKKLEGKIRNFGTHAAGIVISSDHIVEDIPLHMAKVNKDALKEVGMSWGDSVETSDMMTTQFDMEEVEEIGLLKFDFLQIDTLRQMKLAIDLIKDQYGEINFDINNLDTTDKKVLDTIKKMKLTGLFQISGSTFKGGDFPQYDKETGKVKLDENNNVKTYHKQGVMEVIKCEQFNDIVVPNAIGRPGPLTLGMHRKYAYNKKHPDEITYPHPLLEGILKETYGNLIFQEQMIKMAQLMAGFSFSEADQLRKACGKKKIELLEDIEPKFISGCMKNNIPKNVIDEMWNLCIEFGQYAFNKSHSTAYGYICFQTSYLKTYYTKEFICALLTSEANKSDEKLLEMIQNLKGEYKKLEIINPDINVSEKTYYPVKDSTLSVIAPIFSIKGIGQKISDSIVDRRKNIGEFVSIDQFMTVMNSGGKSLISNRVADDMVKNGCFNSIDTNKDNLKKGIRRQKSIKKIVVSKSDELESMKSLF